MRILLIDNHDSYTDNLAQLLATSLGTLPLVVSADDPALTAELVALSDAVVISPGPGHPARPADVGAWPGLLADDAATPVLGVCLGHQGLALLSGAQVVHAPQPRHGHLSPLRHSGDGLFAGLPQGLEVVRYHSLSVAEPMPSCLVADAWSEDGVLQAFHRIDRPWWAVQFHPESVATEHGAQMVRSFARLTGLDSAPAGDWREPRPGDDDTVRPVALRPWDLPPVGPADRPAADDGPAADGRAANGRAANGRAADRTPAAPHLLHRALPMLPDPEALHDRLLAGRWASFWLDSARTGDGQGRFSFLGHPAGALGEVLLGRVGAGVEVHAADGTVRGHENAGLAAVLQQRLRQRARPADPELPFDLDGGYVVALGYEAGAELGLPITHRSAAPDALMIAATRMVVLDHRERCCWVLALVDPADAEDVADGQAWIDEAAAVACEVPEAPAGPVPPREGDGAGAVVPWDPAAGLRLGRAAYHRAFDRIQQLLHDGETYELCLTDAWTGPAPADLTAAYRRLRRGNPAPHAALLTAGPTSVLSSSPEQFLRLHRDGTLLTKPIKGTAPRHADPARDAEIAETLRAGAKTRAENLMIVDLLRNDLARVCETGSVHVPSLMAVESYATVHQLVTTVVGRLRPDRDVTDALRACFPGGSMTGAPKERTLALIDEMEGHARGLYSGTLGYVALSGAADLSIVIRTAVVHEDRMHIGAGGAIVLDSDAEEERQELLLKLGAVLESLVDR
ncbi:chorismate-binding protein [Brachybacterium sp. EF45031]|uniref:chorismate-binding protein n=1 Tax=Brachybacterium sillae TaxID=2810536 RepID=UPI00217D3689|nr:chorismate-binding protein [Brachybacterium sillae]MCS6712039.1 chorismate-binding protein [Brachybacterium sillae]